jgi:hypothetical protein
MRIKIVAQRVTAATLGVATGMILFGGVGHADPAEDSSRWSCAVHGNHICGPGAPGHAPAGFYVDGKMTVAWTDYDHPWRDPLDALGDVDPKTHKIVPPKVDAYGRPLPTTPLPADQVPAWHRSRKMTDADVEDARRVAAVRFNPDGTPTGRTLTNPPASTSHGAAGAPTGADTVPAWARQAVDEWARRH